MAYVLGSMDAAPNAEFHSSQALTAIFGRLALQRRFGVSGARLDKPARVVLACTFLSDIDGRIGTGLGPPVSQSMEGRRGRSTVPRFAAPGLRPEIDIANKIPTSVEAGILQSQPAIGGSKSS